MSILVPIALYGWIVIALLLFKKEKLAKAIASAMVFGFILLPMYTYDLPLIGYNKVTAIVFAILLLKGISRERSHQKIKLFTIDYIAFAWFTIGPIMTSTLNGLGLYDGVNNMINHYLSWGFFYLIGRKNFYDKESIDSLLETILIGTLIYVPLCLIELRMSPQLSNWIYGIFPHSFAQHVRNGGFRPIVFMQHGLMVSLWMAVGTNIVFYYWRFERKKRISNISSPLVFIILFCITILTKSVGPALLMLFGILFQMIYLRTKSIRLIVILSFVPLVYIVLRITGIINSNLILVYASKYFPPERIQSLWFRLFQEDLYAINMKDHLLFGWGGWNRSAPMDPRTNQLLIVRDSMWLGIYSEYGFIGLISTYVPLLYGIFSIKDKSTLKETYIVPLSIIVLLFSLDSLLNSMINPIYLVCSGALVSVKSNMSIKIKK